MTDIFYILLVLTPFVLIILSGVFFQRAKSRQGVKYELQHHLDPFFDIFGVCMLVNVIMVNLPDEHTSSIGYWFLSFIVSAIVTGIYEGIVRGICKKIWPLDASATYTTVKVKRGLKALAYIFGIVVILGFEVTLGITLFLSENNDTTEIVLSIFLMIFFVVGAIFDVRSLLKLYR